MAETDDSAGPVAFAATFPPEPRFTGTAAELAARLASASGCAPDAVDEVRGAVGRAVSDALPSAAAIDVTLRTGADTFEADVACDGRVLLHCSKPRSA